MFQRKPREFNKSPADPQLGPYSVMFADYLAGLDGNKGLYKSVRQAVDLCESALKDFKTRADLSGKLGGYEERLSEMSYFGSMSDGELNHFKALLDRFTALSHERGELLEKLAGFDRSLPELERVEGQAGSAIPEIQGAEEYQRALRHDIACLEGEKEDLRYEHSYLSSGLVLISKLSVGLTGMFVFAAMLLAYLSVSRGRDVFMYIVALIFLATAAAVILFFFRKRMSFELGLNARKQQKAVRVLNQKSVVFAFYSNFLNFCYDKYHVRSAKMLESHLKDYGQYKEVTGRIDNARAAMYETQREIEGIMAENHIDQVQVTLESFAKNTNLERQKRAYDELSAAKAETERRMNELEERREAIWDLLARLQTDRPEAQERLDGVIETYLCEIGRILGESSAG